MWVFIKNPRLTFKCWANLVQNFTRIYLIRVFWIPSSCECLVEETIWESITFLETSYATLSAFQIEWEIGWADSLPSLVFTMESNTLFIHKQSAALQYHLAALLRKTGYMRWLSLLTSELISHKYFFKEVWYNKDLLMKFL